MCDKSKLSTYAVFYETTGWSSFNRFFTLLFLEQSKRRTTKK